MNCHLSLCLYGLGFGVACKKGLPNPKPHFTLGLWSALSDLPCGAWGLVRVISLCTWMSSLTQDPQVSISVENQLTVSVGSVCELLRFC